MDGSRRVRTDAGPGQVGEIIAPPAAQTDAPTAGLPIGVAIVTPGVNSAATTIHLAEIGKQVAAGAHAVLVCDGAGWHQTGHA